jgi:hypothetical protein
LQLKFLFRRNLSDARNIVPSNRFSEDRPMVRQVLRVTQNTVFKRRPVQASQLEPEERYSVSAGATLEIQSYAYADANGEFDGHIKFAIANQAYYIRGMNTWYVYNRHAQVEFDGKVVYPQEEQAASFILKVTDSTLFKRRPLQSSQLSAEEVQAIAKGASFELQSYAYADAQGDFNNHIKFALEKQEDYIRGLSTWFVYEQHAQVEFDNDVVYPIPQVPSSTPSPAPSPAPGAPRPFQGRSFKLPGNQSTFYTDQPIIPGGSFTWGEATKNGTRIPKTTREVSNILALARQLQRARNQIGRPFRITSWYRPEPYNRQAGGVRNSQHLNGSAADISVSGYSGRQVANAVMSWWPGGVGVYPGNRRHIVHLDIGGRRKWGF